MQNKQRVIWAEAYREGAMSSTGSAMNMLHAQYKFPDEYNPHQDKLMSEDHDRLLAWDHDHTRKCFEKFLGTGELGLGSWVREAPSEQILDFLKEIMKADPAVTWIGYRVLGTVRIGSGHPVWTLQLFAKHRSSKTKLYNMKNAPDLIRFKQRSRRSVTGE